MASTLGPFALSLSLALTAAAVTAAAGPARVRPARTKHLKVYHQPGRFGGWPANHGIWSWGDEILVGFGAGYHKDLGNERHNIDRERPEHHLLARSLDGGETWKIEDPSVNGDLIPVGEALHGVTPTGQVERPWTDCPGGVPFTHPDFAMTLRMTNGGGGPSRFYYSTNRGHRWRGPFRLPDLDGRPLAPRTDYLVNGPSDCHIFVTASKAGGGEGRAVAARTTDGGKSWKFLGWMTPEPVEGYTIMPSTIRLGPNELLSAIRRRTATRRDLALCRSTDNGRTWVEEAPSPTPDLGEGNPASMIRLKDGRICLTYGYRKAPFGVRARLSSDGGRTWGPELTLRDDAGNRDVGYPRTVQRANGDLVTIYYIWDKESAPERYIGATIWTAPG